MKGSELEPKEEIRRAEFRTERVPNVNFCVLKNVFPSWHQCVVIRRILATQEAHPHALYSQEKARVHVLI